MGGCCCTSKNTELSRSSPLFRYPVSEERQPLSSHHATVSALSSLLLVDTNLDTSVPDTYRPPPVPIPYETYVGRSTSPSRIEESSRNKSEVALQTTDAESMQGTKSSVTLGSMLKNLESDEMLEIKTELGASKEVEDEKSGGLQKTSEPTVPPLQDDDDACPICLEEYDAENPKLVTKCDHYFHLACILEWMERSDTCPVCDQIWKDDEFWQECIGGFSLFPVNISWEGDKIDFRSETMR